MKWQYVLLWLSGFCAAMPFLWYQRWLYLKLRAELTANLTQHLTSLNHIRWLHNFLGQQGVWLIIGKAACDEYIAESARFDAEILSWIEHPRFKAMMKGEITKPGGA